MPLVFATTVSGGVVILYFLSRGLLLSSFRDLETDQMQQKWGMHSQVSLQNYLRLGRTTSDYAHWDHTYDFMTQSGKSADFS
jgi:sensor domain CHASE-containing protein